VPLIEEWRELTKLVNTYLEPLPRLSMRAPAGCIPLQPDGGLDRPPVELQPEPAEHPHPHRARSQIRDCFIAADGMRLVVADYSQIELRLMAFLAQEPALIDAYRRRGRAPGDGRGGRRHPRRAGDQAPARACQGDQLRIMYGLSAFGLSEQVDMPVDEARAFIDAYFAKYPRVRVFRDKVIAEAVEAGYVTTVFGRRRGCPSCAPTASASARSASAWRSIPCCRAAPPTSSRWPCCT